MNADERMRYMHSLCNRVRSYGADGPPVLLDLELNFPFEGVSSGSKTVNVGRYYEQLCAMYGESQVTLADLDARCNGDDVASAISTFPVANAEYRHDRVLYLNDTTKSLIAYDKRGKDCRYCWVSLVKLGELTVYFPSHKTAIWFASVAPSVDDKNKMSWAPVSCLSAGGRNSKPGPSIVGGRPVVSSAHRKKGTFTALLKAMHSLGIVIVGANNIVVNDGAEMQSRWVNKTRGYERLLEDMTVVSGDKVVDVYVRNSYGTMGSSCMRNNPYNCLSFYANNKENIRLATWRDDGKIVARALLWRVDEDGWYIDRLYGGTAEINFLHRYYCKEVLRYNNRGLDAPEIDGHKIVGCRKMLAAAGLEDEESYCVTGQYWATDTLNNPDSQMIPYMDSFCINGRAGSGLAWDKICLRAYDESPSYYEIDQGGSGATLRGVPEEEQRKEDGSYESDSSYDEDDDDGTVYCQYYNEVHPIDECEYVVIENNGPRYYSYAPRDKCVFIDDRWRAKDDLFVDELTGECAVELIQAVSEVDLRTGEVRYYANIAKHRVDDDCSDLNVMDSDYGVMCRPVLDTCLVPYIDSVGELQSCMALELAEWGENYQFYNMLGMYTHRDWIKKLEDASNEQTQSQQTTEEALQAQEALQETSGGLYVTHQA